MTSARHTSAAAFWAGWADALAVLQSRAPAQVAIILNMLDSSSLPGSTTLRELQQSASTLDNEGWHRRPAWRDLAAGLRPPRAIDAEPGEWAQGWQYHSSLVRNNFLRETVVQPRLDRASLAVFRSQSGPRAGAWLTALPTEPGLQLKPLRMQIALRRRLRLPLPLSSNICGGPGRPGCRGHVDVYGDHRAACPRSGLIQRRAKPVERAWIRVTREAVGPEGHVVPQRWLSHTTTEVAADDHRRLDLVVYGAHAMGRVYCCDATVVSTLRRNGVPQPGADNEDGICLRRALRRKRRRYPELCRPGPHQLLVLACEVGGRWHRSALRFVRELVALRSRRAPVLLRASARLAWDRRWWALLSIAVQDAVAASLVEGPASNWCISPSGFDSPFLADVLGDQC